MIIETLTYTVYSNPLVTIAVALIAIYLLSGAARIVPRP